LACYLNVIQQEPGLVAQYPGAQRDKLFNDAYRHVSDGNLYDDCGCNGLLIHRSRLDKDSPSPWVVIKGACDYADSHKMKAWQHCAAATAAACMKAFLDSWVPSLPSFPGV
jgi:hypothetical protein